MPAPSTSRSRQMCVAMLRHLKQIARRIVLIEERLVELKEIGHYLERGPQLARS